MVEIYLGLATLAAASYFLWGVYDPDGQKESEYRWMHAAVGGTQTMRFREPKLVRLRNVIGLVVCLTVFSVAVFGRGDEDTPQSTRASKSATKDSPDADVEALMRRESEKADAYYQHVSPYNAPMP